MAIAGNDFSEAGSRSRPFCTEDMTMHVSRTGRRMAAFLASTDKRAAMPVECPSPINF
jgi:hypothetical protein